MSERASAAWIRAWPVASALLFGALSIHPLRDNDLYWHLALGRAVLESGSRVVPEPIALTSFHGECVVHEWAWDVLLYSIQHRLGWGAVSALVLVVALLAGAALGLLVTRWRGRATTFPITLAVTLLAAPPILTRINERPESATMIFWPLGLILADAVSRAEERRALALRAGALVGLALVWAQIHLTVLPFSIAAAVIVLPRTFGNTAIFRVRLATVGLVLASIFTSAAGTLVFSVPSRVHGFVTETVPEWMPVRWNMLDITDVENVQAPSYLLLLLAGAYAASRDPRARRVEIALALLGLGLALLGRRGVTPATILALPILVAAHGARIGSLASLRARVGMAVAIGAGVVALDRMVEWTQKHAGPLGRVGLDDGWFPGGAARWLSRDRGEHRALTTYRTGPTIGFETHGRVRTFVDSRSPIFVFDDAALGAAHVAWSRAIALPVVTARWGFDVAIVERNYEVCSALAASALWAPVLVEPRFTTFVRSRVDVTPLRRLAPCGDVLLDARSCAPPRADLDLEIDRVADAGQSAFASYLRADRELRCATGMFDGDAIRALLPPARNASGFEAARDDIEGWLLALAGRRREAISLLAPHVAEGKTWVLRDSLSALAKGGADDALRDVLRSALEQDPSYDGALVELANACARLGDLRCARLEAARAAALGRIDVGPALCFVRRAGDPAASREAEKWLETLKNGAPSTLAPMLDCGAQ